jgi:hypothetical protein
MPIGDHLSAKGVRSVNDRSHFRDGHCLHNRICLQQAAGVEKYNDVGAAFHLMPHRSPAVVRSVTSGPRVNRYFVAICRPSSQPGCGNGCTRREYSRAGKPAVPHGIAHSEDRILVAWYTDGPKVDNRCEPCL